MRDNKLVITTKSTNFHMDLLEDTGVNLKHELYSIIKHKENLVDTKFNPNVRNDIHEHGKLQIE